MSDQLGLRTWVPAPDCDDEGDRRVVESFVEVGEEPQREVVCPRNVIDQDRERALVGEVDRQPVQPVDDTKDIRGLPLPEDRLGECRRWRVPPVPASAWHAPQHQHER
jgi:hypothetical protein